MINVWLVRASGEGSFEERFCFDRKSVGEAILAMVIGEPNPDPILSEPQQDELTAYLELFNDPENWHLGHWETMVGETGKLEAFVIDPKSVKGLLNRVVDEWLGI